MGDCNVLIFFDGVLVVPIDDECGNFNLFSLEEAHVN